MISLIRLDFKRAILNKQFFITVIIGLLLSLAHFYFEVYPHVGLSTNGSSYYNPFVKWMSNNSFSTYSLIYFMIFPLLSSIPYSDSYWLDLNSGFLKNIYTRVKKSNYLISKYITNFIVGGITVVIPLMFNLYIMFMTLPAVSPNIFSQMEAPRDMLYNLYYSYPYMYVLVYLFISFVFGGVFSSIGLSISTFCKNRFLVIAIPTIVYISMSILEIAGLPQLVPMKFLAAGQPVLGINIISVIIIFIILMILSLASYILGAIKNEII